MTLTDYGYLEIEASTNATFEFNVGFEVTSQGSKSYLVGERGQYLRELIGQTPESGSFDATRRTGYWLDGGAGDWQETFAFESGNEDIQWGDGSGGTGQSNVTTEDASGAGVAGISRKNIFDWWLAKSKSDSGGDTVLHFGEWTDGNIAHVSGVSAGAFGEPMPVAVREWSAGTDLDQPGTISGSITVSHAALWGGDNTRDRFDDAVGAVLEAANAIPDE